MSYLNLFGTFLEDVVGVRNRTVLAESVLETRDDAVHLPDLVLQVQRCVRPAKRNTKGNGWCPTHFVATTSNTMRVDAGVRRADRLQTYFLV